MPIIKLQEKDTLARFGVSKAIENFPSKLTEQEEGNVRIVLQYMEVRVYLIKETLSEMTDCVYLLQIAYSPKENTGAASVSHFCSPGNTFAAPSTFPNAHTAEEYAEDHKKVMSALNDLHIVQFDVVTAKGLHCSCVVLRWILRHDLYQKTSSPSDTPLQVLTVARTTTEFRLLDVGQCGLPVGTS